MVLNKYIHIDVLFKQIQPELLLQNILSDYHVSSSPDMWEHRPLKVSSTNVSEACYCHCARTLPVNLRRTEDEIQQRFREFEFFMNHAPRGGIFSFLVEYSNHILRFQNAQPQCRQEHILEWRERTLALGQDLFTCAGLAARDLREHSTTYHFSWPSAIQTDNLSLRRMLARGMSENHFHLNGSTQIFPLAWCFLMNHPASARSYFNQKEFRENLTASASLGVRDNKNDWTDRIYDAAWIRAYLFRFITQRSLENPIDNDFEVFHSALGRHTTLTRGISSLRFQSAKLKQNQGMFCLDYAITEEVVANNHGANRLLSGERSFLYHCFLRCFAGTFTAQQMDLFYLYLLIKLRFREELIQVNGRKGFRNFSDYQDRKSMLWGDRPEYWEESYRLSLASTLSRSEPEERFVRSLEMRINHKTDPHSLLTQIRSIDLSAEYDLMECKESEDSEEDKEKNVDRLLRMKQDCLMNAQERASYFYTLHFIKKQLIPVTNQSNTYIRSPRNADVRREVEEQAKATGYALDRYSYLCSRIRGIDAASHEIGCRPETFAVAFRYLRNYCPVSPRTPQPRYWPYLNITYHAGEDFLDLTDGLRAIDEAICFINLERGDRLGHALALGTNPEQYYRIKDYRVYMPAQDLLDNLVWLLFRSLEWNVTISTSLRSSLHEQANQLLHRIYGELKVDERFGSTQYMTLDDYYRSWKLRGDDPSIYREAFLNPDQFPSYLNSLRNEHWSSCGSYDRAKLDEQLWEYSQSGESAELRNWLLEPSQTDQPLSRTAPSEDARYMEKIQYLLYQYHYGVQERLNGQKIVSFGASPEYVELVRAMQNRMMELIMIKGISIECNPSSNKLIGTFDKYEHHPIFRFNSFSLSLPEYQDWQVRLNVSVNTDDMGVFDTSLENEYALLYGCLQDRKKADGSQQIDNASILDYLNHLRRMGNDMVFPKAVSQRQRRARRNS